MISFYFLKSSLLSKLPVLVITGLSLFAFLLPTAGMAVEVDMIGAGVDGMGASTHPGGVIASKQGLNNAATYLDESFETKISNLERTVKAQLRSLENEVDHVGQGIMQGQAKHLAAYRKLQQAKADTAHDTAIQSQSAKDALAAKNTYLTTGSTSSMACGTPSVGAAISAGKRLNHQMAAGAAASVAQRAQNYGYDHQIQRQWIATRPESLNSNTVAPMDSSSIEVGSQADQDAAAYILQVLHPNPVIKLTTDDQKLMQQAAQHPEKTSAEMARYIQLRKQYRAASSPAENLLAKIKQSHTSTLPVGDWATAQWQTMGGDGEAPGVTSDGKMSAASLLDLLVDSRYANPYFYNRVNNVDNGIGLARERTLMLSTISKQLQVLIGYTEQLALMRGIEYADGVNDQYRPKIQKARDEAAGWIEPSSGS